MRRDRLNHDKDHFDLLPVIAILMCLMGSLVLVTLSVASLSIGPGAGEGWLPIRDSNLKAKIPVLVEWDGTQATIHRGTQHIVGEWREWARKVNVDKKSFTVGKDGASPVLLDQLKLFQEQKATHYALFAVRPSGFSSFNAFVAKFRESDISVGYEPISQSKPVKLMLKQEGRP